MMISWVWETTDEYGRRSTSRDVGNIPVKTALQGREQNKRGDLIWLICLAHSQHISSTKAWQQSQALKRKKTLIYTIFSSLQLGHLTQLQQGLWTLNKAKCCEGKEEVFVTWEPDLLKWIYRSPFEDNHFVNNNDIPLFIHSVCIN